MRTYGDYFWLCIPKELLEVAKSYVAKGWGILIFDKNKRITIARKADRRECLFRQETLTEAITHSLCCGGIILIVLGLFRTCF